MLDEGRPRELSSDLELVHRSQAGDRAAFSALVERHQDAVFRFARSLSANTAEAEDALQEAFISAWRHAAQFRGEGSVKGWLFSIARNAALGARRKAAARPVEYEPSLEALGLAAGWGDESLGLAATLERRDSVERALSKLSTEDQEILLLRDVEGLSGEEAARVLALGVPAVKSRLHRARLRLAGALREGGFHD